jgi:hypothetical protein
MALVNLLARPEHYLSFLACNIFPPFQTLLCDALSRQSQDDNGLRSTSKRWSRDEWSTFRTTITRRQPPAHALLSLFLGDRAVLGGCS